MVLSCCNCFFLLFFVCVWCLLSMALSVHVGDFFVSLLVTASFNFSFLFFPGSWCDCVHHWAGPCTVPCRWPRLCCASRFNQSVSLGCQFVVRSNRRLLQIPFLFLVSCWHLFLYVPTKRNEASYFSQMPRIVSITHEHSSALTH